MSADMVDGLANYTQGNVPDTQGNTQTGIIDASYPNGQQSAVIGRPIDRMVGMEMALSRKHFRALAEILAAHRRKPGRGSSSISPKAFGPLVDSMVAFCDEDNPNFDEDRFRAAAVAD